MGCRRSAGLRAWCCAATTMPSASRSVTDPSGGPRRRRTPPRVRAVVDIRPTPRCGVSPGIRLPQRRGPGSSLVQPQDVPVRPLQQRGNGELEVPGSEHHPPAGPLDGDVAGRTGSGRAIPVAGREIRAPAHTGIPRGGLIGEPAEVACVDGRRIRFCAIRVKNPCEIPASTVSATEIRPHVAAGS